MVGVDDAVSPEGVESARGFSATASWADFPLTSILNTIARGNEMSRNFVRSALLPSGPCPEQLGVIAASEKNFVDGGNITVIVPPDPVDVGIHAVKNKSPIEITLAS